MSFVEQRFPEDHAYNGSGGPAYSTDVVAVASGFEKRNQNWTDARRRWDVGYTRTQAQLDTLLAFFHAMKGKANGFRFRDHADYTVTGSAGILSAVTGGWQMVKRYASAAGNTDRTIRKPVSGTVTVSGGGTYAVDYSTGIVTKSAGPDPTGWTGEFDVPVRFDTDELRAQMLEAGPGRRMYSVPSVPIVEIRL